MTGAPEALARQLHAVLDGQLNGYRRTDEASGFTREYKRLFGEPPVRDVERLREAAIESAAM
jgi:hypothetical protein